MGLFGLSASEALYLTRQLNNAQERRNDEQMRLMKQHQHELTKMSMEQQAELRELENQRIAQIGTEARQMEPLIILSVYEQYHKESKPGDKPNGRIVYTIFTGGTYIDMNVIEGFGKNAVVENVIEWLHAHTAMSEYEYELMRKELEE